MFDLVIKDAEIHDGAGSAPVHGDLGVDCRYRQQAWHI
jgi:N-acyl-D-amino-acid deacylase